MSAETPPDKHRCRNYRHRAPGRFMIEVEGRTVGLADYHDSEGHRVFPHTEVTPQYQGRGLATILVAEALRSPGTRAADRADLLDGG